MKTVSGKVILTKPITLSKATKMISRFTATDNEATPAFAAYLRSTCAAFDELVQLHKEFKSPLQESRVKEERTSDVLTKETPITVKRIKPELVDVDERVYVGGDLKNVRDKLEKPREVVSIEKVADVHGVLKKSKRNKESDGDVIKSVGNEISVNVSEKVRKDAVNVGEVKGERGSEELKNNLSDVGGVNKKSKKKRERDEDVVVVDDQSNDAIIMNEVKKETGSTSEEMKKSKKKRDKLGKENHEGGLDAVKEVDGIREAVDTVKNNVDEQKKHKKKSKVKEVKESNHAGNAEPRDEENQIKEEKESCSIKNSEQRSETNAENKDGVVNGKKHKKKKSHESEKGDNVRNIETEATEKKASRKRKHENVVDGELDGTHDAGRSKKKKIQTLG